jgi:tRNA nucleotidyltransferase (CCA-adding enzyme)
MGLHLPPVVVQLFSWFQSAGASLWLAGGCLRDLSLNQTPSDWDFATNLLPEDIADLCRAFGCQVFMTGLKHGTVTVIVNNTAFEITTFRKDGPYGDHRRPDYVEFSADISDDLARRDFTVNAMAYSPLYGWLDPFDGQKDLKRCLIRTVGEPKARFEEDALRILRGIRICSQFGFHIDPDTMAAMRQFGFTLEKISKERIRDELNKILLSDRPGLGFRLLESLGLLIWTIPELIPCAGFDQRSRHHYLDVFEHALNTAENTPEALPVRLAALLHDIAKPRCFTIDEHGAGHFYGHEVVGAEIAADILKRLKYDYATIFLVQSLVLHHMAHLSKPGDAAVKKLMLLLGKDNMPRLFSLQEADLQASKPPHEFSLIDRLKAQVNRIIASQEPLSIKDLAINGYDLIHWGVAPKERGKALNRLLEAVYEDPALNTRASLRGLLRNMGIVH